MATFLALALSTGLGLGSGESADDTLLELGHRGWQKRDGPPSCSALPATGFFELDGEDENMEFYRAHDGDFWSPRLWPEPGYQCRPIQSPTFIQEVP